MASTARSADIPAEDELLTKAAALTVQEAAEAQLPAHRNHDPQFNMKRSDPFQFGSRYLQEDDDIFEFNAWDHVETDDTYKEYAEQQYAKQRESPVSDFDKRKSTYLSLFSRCCDDTPKCIVHLNFLDDQLYQFFRSHLTHHTYFPSIIASYAGCGC